MHTHLANSAVGDWGDLVDVATGGADEPAGELNGSLRPFDVDLNEPVPGVNPDHIAVDKNVGQTLVCKYRRKVAKYLPTLADFRDIPFGHSRTLESMSWEAREADARRWAFPNAAECAEITDCHDGQSESRFDKKGRHLLGGTGAASARSDWGEPLERRSKNETFRLDKHTQFASCRKAKKVMFQVTLSVMAADERTIHAAQRRRNRAGPPVGAG